MEQKNVTCCRCKMSKPQSAFYAHEKCPNGYRRDCKSCVVKANQRSRLKRKHANPVVSWRANRIKCDATVAELRAIATFYEKVARP